MIQISTVVTVNISEESVERNQPMFETRDEVLLDASTALTLNLRDVLHSVLPIGSDILAFDVAPLKVVDDGREVQPV
jgi:hypothetical protein